MQPLNNVALNQLHQQELFRQAQQDRLAREAKANQKTNPPYAPLLAGLGRQMVEMGQRLQAQYETPTNLGVETN